VAQREAIRYVTGRYGVSTRRACRLLRTTRSSVYYRGRKDPLTALRQRMRELAQTRVRFGYRRLRVLLLRDGWTVGKALLPRVHGRRAGLAPEAALAPRHGGASGAASVDTQNRPLIDTAKPAIS
jgi:hypothetical protein